jgi:hypothetical protein
LDHPGMLSGVCSRDDSRNRRPNDPGQTMIEAAELDGLLHRIIWSFRFGSLEHSSRIYSFRATAVSLVMFCSKIRPRCRSKMPSLRQSCN